MAPITQSIAMSRILGIEKTKRVNLRVRIESDFMQLIHENTLDVSDTLNIALEKHLREKGLIGA